MSDVTKVLDEVRICSGGTISVIADDRSNGVRLEVLFKLFEFYKIAMELIGAISLMYCLDLFVMVIQGNVF